MDEHGGGGDVGRRATDEVSAPCRRRHMWPVCKCRHVIAHQAAAWEETQSSLPSRRLRHTLTPVSQPVSQSAGDSRAKHV